VQSGGWIGRMTIIFGCGNPIIYKKRTQIWVFYKLKYFANTVDGSFREPHYANYAQ